MPPKWNGVSFKTAVRQASSRNLQLVDDSADALGADVGMEYLSLDDESTVYSSTSASSSASFSPEVRLAPAPRTGEKVGEFRNRVWDFVRQHCLVKRATRTARAGISLKLYFVAKSTLGHVLELADEDTFGFWHPGLVQVKRFGEAGEDDTACSVAFHRTEQIHVSKWGKEGIVAEVRLRNRPTPGKPQPRTVKKLRQKGLRPTTIADGVATARQECVKEVSPGPRHVRRKKRQLKEYLRARAQAWERRVQHER